MAALTRFPGLGFRKDAEGCWRFVDLDGGKSIGSMYATKEELLADLDKFGRQWSGMPPDHQNPLDLTHTRLALEEYDRRVKETDRQIDEANTNAATEAWVQATAYMAQQVRLAFFADSHDRNSLNNCLAVDLATLRAWSKGEPTPGS